MTRLRPIMLGGTGSDVGKSILVAGLCRIFLQDGYHPAPFKAQNMALNSYVTPDGLEIGRAQAVQAQAAGLDCMAEMNPVLLKPNSDTDAQTVVMGRPAGNNAARKYFDRERLRPLKGIAVEAFKTLASKFNPIVMEGAGSVAEINLLDTDFVNMPMAEAVDAPVILVADIDRGGVFAQAYGSIMLLPENFRKRIKGIIVNKFRGDMGLFKEGRRMLEERCGVPVIGVVPYFRDISIEEEDAVRIERRNRKASSDNLVNIAVVILQRMSNFTDFDILERDPRIHVYFTSEPEELGKADIIVIPGSKNTVSDLRYLKANGCARAIREAAAQGKGVVGICGGYQIMGLHISDPDGVEGEASEEEGLGILPCRTRLTGTKTLRRSEVSLPGHKDFMTGYEIHMGVTDLESGAMPMFSRVDGSAEGCKVSENVWGTYLHGILDNPEIVDLVIRRAAAEKGLPGECTVESTTAYRERQYDLLASHLRKYLDMETIYSIMRPDSSGR